VSSCDAGARPASSAEDGSQKPPCDPKLKWPERLGDHCCRSIRRAAGLVQTPQGSHNLGRSALLSVRQSALGRFVPLAL
jgi:hypothetical protein